MTITLSDRDRDAAARAVEKLNAYWAEQGYAVNARVGPRAEIQSDLAPGGLPAKYTPLAKLKLRLGAKRAARKADPYLAGRAQ